MTKTHCFLIIFNGTLCYSCNICVNDFCCRLVRHLKLSLAQTFGGCSPHLAAAYSHVSWRCNTNATQRNHMTGRYMMGLAVLITWDPPHRTIAAPPLKHTKYIFKMSITINTKPYKKSTPPLGTIPGKCMFWLSTNIYQNEKNKIQNKLTPQNKIQKPPPQPKKAPKDFQWKKSSIRRWTTIHFSSLSCLESAWTFLRIPSQPNQCLDFIFHRFVEIVHAGEPAETQSFSLWPD